MTSTLSRVYSCPSVMRCGALLFSLLCICLILDGCGKFDRAEWREEVQFASDEIVIVKRVAIAKKSGFPVSRRGGNLEWELTFPDSRTVWKSDGQTQPLSIEAQQGKVYLAADIHSHELCAKYGDPEGSVIFFRWENNSWIRVRRQDYPKDGKVNLLRDPWGRDSSEDVRGLVKSQQKHLRGSNQLVHVPLAERIADRTLDVCQLLKKL